MNYTTKNIFNFKGFGVQKVLNNEKEILVYLFPRRKTAICPRCDQRSKNVYEVGNPRRAKHSIFEGKPVIAILSKRRFFCLGCELPFNERIEWIPTNARTTDHFAKETISNLKNGSFTAICEMYETSYQFLAKTLLSLDVSVKWPEGKLRLGFDEHSYAKRHMMVTVTELGTGTLLAILPYYSRETVEKYLHSRTNDELSRVVELCFDMRFKQRSTVERFFPNASTVVDKFHVLSYLASLIDSDRRITMPNLRSYENIRQIMRKPAYRLTKKENDRLNSIFKQHSNLKQKWDIYQKLSSFYRLKSKEEARSALEEIKGDLSRLEPSYTKDFLGTIKRLEVEILNYFDNRTTNAFTEGVHTKIKMIKRTSFGFRNIEIYIKKVMLAFIPIALILSQLLPH